MSSVDRKNKFKMVRIQAWIQDRITTGKNLPFSLSLYTLHAYNQSKLHQDLSNKTIARFSGRDVMSMIGKILGNFECTALLGKGGMDEVYQAKDQK
jgi:hypothetical protein